MDRLSRLVSRIRCCDQPNAVTGVTVSPGGGSGEVAVTWVPSPASQGVTHYRVYLQRGTGTPWHLADVTNEALGKIQPGRLGLIDAPDYWPWPTGGVPSPRCYVVAAIARGIEGPTSVATCGSPP